MASATSLQIPLVVAIVGGACVVWRLLRDFVSKSTLDNIPGPRSGSIIQGDTGFTFYLLRADFVNLPGNLGQLFERHCWPLLDDLTTSYGGVAKLHGLLGEKSLWVSDPLALHHIIIKDQDRYPLSPSMSSYAAYVEFRWSEINNSQPTTTPTRARPVGYTR